MKTLLRCLAVAVAVAAPAMAAQIVPPAPVAFEPVSVRMTEDSCAFKPESVRVVLAEGSERAPNATLHLTQERNACFAPGAPVVVDVGLGALPPGKWRLEIYNHGPAEEASRTVEFDVQERPRAVNADYSGMWFDSAEAGTGLSIHQGSISQGIFGAWFVYGADHEADWLTLQMGTWISPTAWGGTVYRTKGPWLGAGSYDPSTVVLESVGTAVLQFEPASADPGAPVRLRLSYDVRLRTAAGGVVRKVATKTLVRARF